MSQHKGFQVEVSKEVIRRAKRGEVDAFEQIYLTYFTASHALAMRICGQTAMAEDIVQESFIKMMHNIQKYRGDGLFAGWLSRIVTQKTINRIKGNAKVHLVGDEVLDNKESKDLFSYNWLDACSDIEALLENLSAVSRAVFLLHEVEGFNHKEIAELFDKTESFSKVTLSRAYAKLRKVVTMPQKESESAFK